MPINAGKNRRYGSNEDADKMGQNWPFEPVKKRTFEAHKCLDTGKMIRSEDCHDCGGCNA